MFEDLRSSDEDTGTNDQVDDQGSQAEETQLLLECVLTRAGRARSEWTDSSMPLDCI